MRWFNPHNARVMKKAIEIHDRECSDRCSDLVIAGAFWERAERELAEES